MTTAPSTAASTAASTPTPAPPRRANRRGEGALLRAEILAAAGALLDETGSADALTLRAVARRAGISAPAVYGHFTGLDAVVLVVVQDALADLTARLRAAAGAGDTGTGVADPVARLRAACDAYLAFAAERPQRYRVVFDGAWDAARAARDGAVSPDETTDLGREALAVLAGALRACADAGASTSTDPDADAVALWLGLHGLAHQRAVATAFPWPGDVAERVVAPLARLRGAPTA